MQLIRPYARQRPFEVAVLVTSPVCGILLLALDVRPRSVELAMPVPIQVGWEFGLLVVGVTGLLGLLWPGRLSTGMGLELAAVLVLGTITGMYTVALSVITGAQAVVGASFVAAVAVGSWWRSAEILLDLRRLIEVRQTGPAQPTQEAAP